jgi:hypothetical protein
VYAQTNPAFAGNVLRSFVLEFGSDVQAQQKIGGCVYPLLFLPLALTFSRDKRRSFDHTNKATGFFDWLANSPQLRVGLGSDIRASIPYTKNAIVFSLAHGLLQTDGWQYWARSKPQWRKAPWSAKSDERGRILACARLLGAWCGQLGAATVFQALGVQP